MEHEEYEEETREETSSSKEEQEENEEEATSFKDLVGESIREELDQINLKAISQKTKSTT